MALVLKQNQNDPECYDLMIITNGLKGRNQHLDVYATIPKEAIQEGDADAVIHHVDNGEAVEISLSTVSIIDLKA